MNYEEILRAYNRAVAGGADRAQAAAEVRKLTGMTPAQLQAHVSGGGAARPAAGGAAPAAVAPGRINYRASTPEASEARGAVAVAYHRALRAGADKSQLDAEVRRITGMSIGQLQNVEGRINFRHTMRLAVQGATFGFGDELAGLGAALVPGGRDYAQGRDASRRNLAAAREYQTPVGSAIIEGVGSAAVPMLGAEYVGSRILAGTGSRVLAGAGSGAFAGGTAGAVYGAGNADGTVGDRLRGAATGGVTGAVTGGALGGGLSVAARAAGRLTGRTTSRATDQAARVVRQELETAGVPVEQVPARLAAMGQGSVVADLGENLGRQARAAVNNAPELAAPGGPVARIRARTADTRNRVANALRESSGLGQTFEESLAAAEQGIRQVRRQFYGPLEQNFPTVEGPQVAAALRDARITRAAADVAPEVAAGNRPPSFTELQDIMLTLRDDVTAARAAGRPNASRRAAEAYDTLVAAMTQDIPGFTEAQAAYRAAISRVDAHELGRSLANKAPSDIRRALAELPAEAHDAFRQGLLDSVETRLRRREGSAAGDWIDAGQTTQELGRVIASGDDPFNQLMGTLRGREQPWRSTSQKLLGNSTTPEQIADADAFLTDVPTSASGLVSRLVDYALGPNSADRGAAAAMIGRALLAEGPEAAQRLAEMLRRRTVGSGMFGAAAGTAAGGAVTGSAPLPTGGDPNAMGQLQATTPGLLY